MPSSQASNSHSVYSDNRSVIRVMYKHMVVLHDSPFSAIFMESSTKKNMMASYATDVQ